VTEVDLRNEKKDVGNLRERRKEILGKENPEKSQIFSGDPPWEIRGKMENVLKGTKP